MIKSSLIDLHKLALVSFFLWSLLFDHALAFNDLDSKPMADYRPRRMPLNNIDWWGRPSVTLRSVWMHCDFKTWDSLRKLNSVTEECAIHSGQGKFGTHQSRSERYLSFLFLICPRFWAADCPVSNLDECSHVCEGPIICRLLAGQFKRQFWYWIAHTLISVAKLSSLGHTSP